MPRPNLIPAPAELVADHTKRPIFIGTTRKQDNGFFSGTRSLDLTYLRYDIAIPPQRRAGELQERERIVNPDRQFLVASAKSFATPGSFRSELAADLRSRPAGEAIIYVHGFNNTFDDGVLRLTQLATDFRLQGSTVHYSWPSAGDPLGYAYDRDSLLIARDGLDALITEVRQAGANGIILVAHSVGSMLVMETLRQRAVANPGSVVRDIDGVILISPDIDVDLFRAQAARIGDLPNPFGIFISRRDRVLSLSARLTGQRNRLGNVSDLRDLGALDVTIIDVTDFSEGAGHFTAATSPALIRLFNRADAINAAFEGDQSGRTGLLPGTVLTVQNATEIILSPLTSGLQ